MENIQEILLLTETFQKFCFCINLYIDVKLGSEDRFLEWFAFKFQIILSLS